MNNCPSCNSPLKNIPAGVSKKTGKPYPAFQACSNNCGWKPEKPKTYQQPNRPSPLPNDTEILKLAVQITLKDDLKAQFWQDLVANINSLKSIQNGKAYLEVSEEMIDSNDPSF